MRVAMAVHLRRHDRPGINKLLDPFRIKMRPAGVRKAGLNGMKKTARGRIM
jgi:hypothetical protein